jgi:ribose 5-phosphate isomerase B
MNIKVAIGSDHAGFCTKEKIKEFLVNKGYVVEDFGTHSEQSVDYPDYAHPVAIAVEKDSNMKGVLVCGSGVGVCITANKHKFIRAALCWNAEIAELSRKHNDANIVCIPARFITVVLAESIVDVFLNTDFEGGRHENRVRKICI